MENCNESWKKLIRFVGNERTVEGSHRESRRASCQIRWGGMGRDDTKTRRSGMRCGTSQKRKRVLAAPDNSRKQVFGSDSGSQPPPAPPAEILVSTSRFGRLGAGATKKRRILCRRSFRCSVSCGQGAVLFSEVCPSSDVFSCLGTAFPFGEAAFPDVASWQSTCASF